MKSYKFLSYLFLLLLVQFFFLTTKAQEELVPNYLFLFGQIEVSSNTTITHTLTAQGTYWEFNQENENFPISFDTDLETATATISGSTTSNPSFEGSSAWKGFVFPWTPAPYQNTDDIAHGFYKVTNSYNNDYFYIDIRDIKYSNSAFTGYYLPDFFIRFNDDLDIFQWRVHPTTGSWTTIQTGEVLNVWDIKNNGTPPTTSFENFWENALVLTNNGSNHPRIVWGPYQEVSGEDLVYYIYGATSSTPTPPSPNIFSYIASISGDTYEFVDNYYLIGGNFYILYYAKAEFIPTESFSSSTNIVTTSASLSYKSQAHQNNRIYKYELNQNYPNPFNPSTKISYALQEDAKVQIKVYDILGTEVAELVNESKPAGYYDVIFDASALSSGIYIYRITALSG